MGKKSAPPPPDYQALAAQQGTENRNTAQYNADLNRVNQATPYGSLTWSQTAGADGKPQWTQTTTLDPTQQQLLNKQNTLSNQYLDTAQSAVDRVGQSMGTGLDLSGVPQTQYLNGTGQTSAQVATPYSSVGTGPSFQTGLADYQKADLKGPALETAGPGSIQRTFDTNGVRALPGNIDDTSRKRVEDAIMSRINPQYQQDEQALRTRLLNSGIEVGTDAYNKELNNFSQRLNDARMQAVLAGGQEESRQVGLQQGLQGQEFNQAQAKGQFGQTADIASANNALQAASINNQSQIAKYNAQLAAQGQNFNQGLAAANFGNQWGQQGFQNQVTGAGFANQAADNATQRQMQIDQVNQAMQQSQAGFNNQAGKDNVQLQAYLRQLPLNEANALRTGAQVQGPQFSNYYNSTAQSAPIFDAAVAQGNYNSQAGAQNAAGFNAMLGGLAQLGSSYMMSSDPRLKSDVVQVGVGKFDLPIYDYTIQGRRERGYMSTDVRKVNPAAVSQDAAGYDIVNYAALGGRP